MYSAGKRMYAGKSMSVQFRAEKAETAPTGTASLLLLPMADELVIASNMQAQKSNAGLIDSNRPEVDREYSNGEAAE